MTSNNADERKELEEKEALGSARASRFIRSYANSNETINLQVILDIHKEIFKDARPDIAGEYRREPVEITDSKHLPPHFSEVPGRMLEVGKELEEKMTNSEKLSPFADENIEFKKHMEDVQNIISISAWIQHKITHIHPFVEGNGRTARFMTNLILERLGLIGGISIKIEARNKNRYRLSLAQIDDYQDYSQLEEIIMEGVIDRMENSITYLM